MNSSNKRDFKKLKATAVSASISVSVFLSFIKAVAAFSTGSLSVLSSMIDSLSDILASSVSFIAVRFSNRPLSASHRYGYGKAESVSALIQSAFITGSGGFILYDGINRFIHPKIIEQSLFGVAIMCVSIVFTSLLIYFQYYVIKKTKSPALKADSAHYFVDLLTNFAIILSLLSVHYLHWEWLDVLTAIIISAYLLWNACKIALEALSELTDQEVNPEIRQELVNITLQVPEVKGYHDLRTRFSGSAMFVEIHLEMDGNLPLIRAHKIADEVEDKIISRFPETQVLTHQDPFGLREKRLDYEIDGLCSL